MCVDHTIMWNTVIVDVGMCMYVCIYIYIHIYVHIYIYICWLCVYIHIYIYIYIYTHTHACDAHGRFQRSECPVDASGISN